MKHRLILSVYLPRDKGNREIAEDIELHTKIYPFISHRTKATGEQLLVFDAHTEHAKNLLVCLSQDGNDRRTAADL